jgi:hypothetical protein
MGHVYPHRYMNREPKCVLGDLAATSDCGLSFALMARRCNGNRGSSGSQWRKKEDIREGL